MKEKGMSVEQVVNVVDIAIHKLPYIENLMNRPKIRRRRCNSQFNDWEVI